VVLKATPVRDLIAPHREWIASHLQIEKIEAKTARGKIKTLQEEQEYFPLDYILATVLFRFNSRKVSR